MLPPISIVVIGYNEALKLDACFQSILASDYPINKIETIYVDSGSTDKSVEIAQKYTSFIYIEREHPSAARNRNRGLVESTHDIVHFMDGDIELNPDYLKTAVKHLLSSQVHCVFGRLYEYKSNRLGRILLHDYSLRKPGLVHSPGSGGTFMKYTLIQVNGWDERIPRGEETELGERFSSYGYKIWYLNTTMGWHDFGINTLYQFCLKQIKEGFAAGKITSIKSKNAFFKKIKRQSIVNAGFSILFLIVIVSCFLTKKAIVLIILLILYSFFLFIKYRIIKRIKQLDSLIFYFLMGYTRPIVFYGFMKYHIKSFFMSRTQLESQQVRMNIKEILEKKSLN